MTYCGEMTLVKWNRTARQAVSLKCRAWTCEDCADGRKRQLIAQAHRGNANTFLTITHRRSTDLTPEQAAQRIAAAWRIVHKRALREASRDLATTPIPSSGKLSYVWKANEQGMVRRMVRLQNGKLPYLCVIEAHVSGWPHLHILARSSWIDHEWLKVQLWDILGSPVVDVRRIDKKSAKAAYVAKYCGKCAHKFGTTKRYWQTADYELTKYEKRSSDGITWWGMEVRNKTLNEVIELWTMQGWHIEYESLWAIRAAQPP